jgi:hypothetical protein
MKLQYEKIIDRLCLEHTADINKFDSEIGITVKEFQITFKWKISECVVS